MLVPCETVTKNFLPAVRSAVTKILVNHYGFTQTKTAAILGITQAGVNKYLSEKYSDSIKKMEKVLVIKNLSNELAKMIAAKEMGKSEIAKHVCDTCEKFHGTQCMIRHLSEEILEEFSRKKIIKRQELLVLSNLPLFPQL